MRRGHAEPCGRRARGTVPPLSAGVRLWRESRLLGRRAPQAHIHRLLWLALDGTPPQRSNHPPVESSFEGAERRAPARGSGNPAATARGCGGLPGWFLCRARHPALGLHMVRRQTRASPSALARFRCTRFPRVRLLERGALRANQTAMSCVAFAHGRPARLKKLTIYLLICVLQNEANFNRL